jgi:hypothetical protein
VARGQLRADAAYYTGKQGTTPVDVLPVAVTPALLRRGQQRYGIYCTPCHGATGRGDGMVVQRGYRRPPSFHIDRLRNEKTCYFFDVITSGFGAMPDYAAQVAVGPLGDRGLPARAAAQRERALEDVPADRRAEGGDGLVVAPPAASPAPVRP